MKISDIQPLKIEKNTYLNKEKNNDFSEVFKDTLNKVNNLQLEADRKVVEFSAGNKNIDVHDVMINLEKANLALQLTIEIRNKIVESYQEIMRMQV